MMIWRGVRTHVSFGNEKNHGRLEMGCEGVGWLDEKGEADVQWYHRFIAKFPHGGHYAVALRPSVERDGYKVNIVAHTGRAPVSTVTPRRSTWYYRQTQSVQVGRRGSAPAIPIVATTSAQAAGRRNEHRRVVQKED